MLRKYGHQLILLLSVLVSLILHFHVFSYDVLGYHVWRQAQTQTVIDNFYRHGFNIFDPELNNLQFPGGVFRMEFPLYQWLAAILCSMTDHPVVMTRVFTFVIGIFTVYGFYLLARRFFAQKWLAAAGAWAFMFSPGFYYYMVNPLPDDLALCFGVYALVWFMRFYEDGARSSLLLCGVLLCLATLCKLPFVIFGAPLLVMLVRKEIKWKDVFLILLIMLPAITWYAWVIGTWESGTVVAGIFGGGYDWLTYLDYMQHNFISSLPELFINYAALPLFAAGVFYALRSGIIKRNKAALYFFWAFLAVVAYTLYELNMIAKVHDYYLFPFLPFLFLITLYGFKKLYEGKSKFLRGLAIVCIVALPLTAYLRADTRWNLVDPGFNGDFMKYQAQIQNVIPANAICLTGNDDSEMINLYYLDRKGYTFWNDEINVIKIEKYKTLGATYLVSDAVLSDETSAYLSQPIAVFSSVKIYKLQ